MEKTDFIISGLNNGLRIVARHEPTAIVEMFGVIVNAGSRDDPEDMLGMSHFVEHCIFKGTLRRKSFHIINRMEAVGGELNAYTTKELTTVYTVAPAGNISRSAELISDLISNSQFPDKEIDKEREVVSDEINSYLDSPSEAVYDDFEDLFFTNTTLGHNILGNESDLRRIDSFSCREYLKKYFVAKNMVVFYSGPQKCSSVESVINKFFSTLQSGIFNSRKKETFISADFNEIKKLDGFQAHTIMGTRVGDMYSPDRIAVSMLSNRLGGPGMNSLLNVALREKRGLVYNVESSLGLLTDIGLFTIYFGCDETDTFKCKKIVENTILAMAQKPMSQQELARYIRQYVGQLTVSSDNRENYIMGMARSLLYKNVVETDSEIIERIHQVRPSDLQDVANKMISNQLSSLTFE